MPGKHVIRRRSFLVATCAAAASVSVGSEESFAAASRESMLPDIPVPITDTHVHFWDPKHLRYPWLDQSELLNRPYLPANYTDAIAGINVARIVFVQAECLAEQAMAEVEWVTSLAEDDSRIQGIVASAPLESGDAVLPVLETLARNPLLKGIRRHVAGEQDPEFMLRPDFVQGVRHLATVGFACDLGIRRGQLPAATELARRCPDVRFVLCHMGVPDIKNQQLDPWREHIRNFAALPNAYCKLSGVATAADHETWTRDDLVPAIHHMLECFGFERVAFGSDWPVMLLATTYPRWVETVQWAVRGCTESELRDLFRGTAERIYNLGAEAAGAESRSPA